VITASAVLVVVDVQNGFITDKSAPVVPIIVDLVERWQQSGGDVVFTRYLNYVGSPFERIMGWSKVQESPETDIVAELQPLADMSTAIVEKKIYSLFTKDGAALVRQHRWTDLYICGIDTESCVLKTAVDAFELDLTPWVIEDASASHSGDGGQEAGLLVIRRFIGEGQIIRVADVPGIANGTAG
jgi:nicotinamidase-related amidase